MPRPILYRKEKWIQDHISLEITPFPKVLDTKGPFSEGNTVDSSAVVKTETMPVSLRSMKSMHCVTVTAFVKGKTLIAVLITSHFAMKKKNGFLLNSLQIQKVGFGNVFEHFPSHQV